MPELKTAKDLEVWYSAALDKVHFAPDYDAIKTLIERIDRAETALAELKVDATYINCQLTVDAQKSVIDRLKAELAAANERIAALESRCAERQEQVIRYDQALDVLRRENEELNSMDGN